MKSEFQVQKLTEMLFDADIMHIGYSTDEYHPEAERAVELIAGGIATFDAIKQAFDELFGETLTADDLNILKLLSKDFDDYVQTTVN